MTDSWEKRVVPVTPGYNNPAVPATPPAFVFSYDPMLDVLTITSPGGYLQPLADDPTGITNAIMSIDGTANAVPFSQGFFAYDFDSIDYYTAVLSSALSWFGSMPVELTTATMYDAALLVSAFWSGSYLFPA